MASGAAMFAVRLYNAGNRLLGLFGKRRRRFRDSSDELHEAAIAAAGCDDFGDSDYREGLDVYLGALDGESRLTPFGEMMVWSHLITVLANRLRAQRYWTRDPTLLERPIERPIFVLGLPRAGTTAMHHLLGADPANQVLEYWLAAAPQPRPPRESWRTHPDYRRAESDLAAMYRLDPSLKAIHLMTADGPEECRHLLEQSFTDDAFDCNATVPSYTKWYATRDLRASYQHHKRLLQLIGSTDPGRRWLLKYPVHMGNLRTVLEVYPDACFVQTHRDPTKVIPSICSLVAGWRNLYEDDFDPVALGCWQLELWSRRLIDGIAVRAECDSERFFDLHFAEVQSDPIGAVRRMYDHFGMQWSDAGEQAMRVWRADNPPGKYGTHRYSAADYGLDDRAMREAFAPYLNHFEVECE